MKPILYIFVFFGLLISVLSCGLKHKTSRVNKVEFQKKQQDKKLQYLQRELRDSVVSSFLKTETHFQVVDLKGQVLLLETGDILAEEAKIYSWSSKEHILQTDKSQTTYVLAVDTEQKSIEENRIQNLSSKTKYSPITNFTMWVFLFLIGIIVFVVLRKLLKKYFF